MDIAALGSDPWRSRYRFLIRDRDRKFLLQFDQSV
jgi:hypothetical protein